MKTNKLILTPAFLLSASMLLGTATLQADTFTTTVSTDAPTEKVVISYTPPRGSWGYGWGNTRNLGQAFTVSEGFTLEQIVISIYSANTSAGNAGFQLSLYEFDGLYGTVEDPLTPVATLYNGSSTLPEAGQLVNDGFIYFNLPDVVLQSGKTYGFAIKFDSGVGTPNINLNIGNNGFSDGSLIVDSNGGTSFINHTDNRLDLAFFVTGSPIPESSTYALLLGGAALIAAAGYSRLRRRK